MMVMQFSELKDGAIAATSESGSELRTLEFSGPWYGRLSSWLIVIVVLGSWLLVAFRVVTGLLLGVTDASCTSKSSFSKPRYRSLMSPNYLGFRPKIAVYEGRNSSPVFTPVHRAGYPGRAISPLIATIG
eukprot:3894255-Rhodomonas_salina.1